MKSAVCILAGGEATRLPGKLSMAVGDVPMLVRVYRNVSPGRETWLSTKGPLPEEIAALIDAPQVVDRWPLRGPLSGLLSTLSEMRAEWVFAVAGDAPFVDAAFIDRLEKHAGAQYDAIVEWGIPDHGALQRLAGIQSPRLVLQGDNDLMIPTKLSHLLTGLIPDAQIRTYPDAAHGFLVHYPNELAASVTEFLAAHDEDMPSSPMA